MSVFKKNSAFIRKITGSFGVKVGGMGLAFLLQIILARTMGVEQYGFYVYVLTCLNLLLFIGLWGWSSSTVKFVSIYKSKESWAELKGVIVASAWLPFISSVLVSLFLVGVVWYIRDRLTAGLFDVFIIGSLILPVNALLSTRASVMQGLKYAVQGQLPLAIFRPLLLIVLVLGYEVYMGSKLTARMAMGVNFVCALVIFFFAWLQLRRKNPRELRSVKPKYRLADWANVALPMLLVSGFVLLMKQFDIIMLGIFSNPTEAGIYAVACRISELSAFSLVAINVVVAPMIAEKYAEKKIQELQKIATMAAIGVFVLTLPIVFISVVFGEQILSLFGLEFKEGYLSLLILVTGQAVNALAGSVGFFMTMTGRQKKAAIIMGGGAVFNIIANLLLIPKYGMVGAAYATALSMIFWNVLMLIKVRKTIGIDTTIFSILRKHNGST